MESVAAKRLKGYYELTKPNTVWLLFLVGVAGAFVARGRDLALDLRFMASLLSLLLAVAGTNAVTCWIDRDIDGVMDRTKERPLPRGEISPRAALTFGLATFGLGCALSAAVVGRATTWLALGFLFSAVLYNGHLKRKSPLNVLFASPAGMMPVLYAWDVATGAIEWVGVVVGLLVVLWTPAHIWSLALFYSGDYGRAGVPMLPVVLGERAAVRTIAAFNALLVAASVALGVSGFFGRIYLYTAAALSAALLLVTVDTALHPSKERAWRMFKFTSPYLALLYLAMVADRVLAR